MKCLDASAICRLLAGQVDPEERAVMEGHLANCPRCAHERATLSAAVGRLAPDAGEFDDPDLTSDIMTLVRLNRTTPAGATPQPKVTRRLVGSPWLWGPAVAAATIAVVLVTGPFGDSPEAHRFQSRGVGINPDRWVSIRAFRQTDAGYEPLTKVIQPEDALAFAYTNRSEGAFRYLMILAVDSTERVFWYYPAHLDPRHNPRSITISPCESLLDLPDQVRHDLHPGPLRLIGLFSNVPLDVRAVESTVRDDLVRAGTVAQLKHLDVPGTGQHSLLLEVADRFALGPP